MQDLEMISILISIAAISLALIKAMDPAQTICSLICHTHMSQLQEEDQSPSDQSPIYLNEGFIQARCRCMGSAWARSRELNDQKSLDPVPDPILPTPEQVDELIKNLQQRGAIVRLEQPDGSVREVRIPPLPKPKKMPRQNGP